MSEIKKLTRLGGDTRKLAALLQAKAPKGEMLAYISPQEAALLKSRGGSGKPHADTGIPSYQIEDYFSAEDMNFSPAPQVNVSSIGMDPAYMAEGLTYEGEPNAFQPPPTAPLLPFSSQQRDVIRSIGEDAAGGAFGRQVDYGYPGAGLGYALRREPPQAFAAPSLGAPAVGGGGGAGPGISDQISNALGIKKSDLPLLGLAGVQTLLGGQQTRRAARQGQQAARRMESMAAPYRAQGAQLQAQAQRGELTPQAQQSLQAAQAQIAQGVQARGGVGAAQAAGQVEAIRQQLLQSQADYGLKLSGIGDQIAMGAIREGIQADQYVNQLTSSYMNNVMRMVGSAYGQQQPMIVLGGGGR